MTTWPILSVVTFLPLVGALFIYIARGDDEAARAQCALDRAVDHARHLRGVAASWSGASMPPIADFQFVEKHVVARPAASSTTWASTASRCRS